MICSAASFLRAQAFLSLSLLIGCAAQVRESGPTRLLVERASDHRPEWILKPPTTDQFFYATGFATRAPSLNDGKKGAALAAAGEVVSYLGLDVSAHFEERQTTLMSEVLNLVDSTGRAHVTRGRAAELYFEKYRDADGGASADSYDVYLLLKIPVEELEAERATISNERDRAIKDASDALAHATADRIGVDVVGVVARLCEAYRHLGHHVGQHAADDLSTRIEARLAEIGARTALKIERKTPAKSGPGGLRIEAAFTDGGVLVPLQRVRVLVTTTAANGSSGGAQSGAITDATGHAAVTFDTSSGDHAREGYTVRLDPSMFPGAATGAEGQAEREQSLEVALAPLRTASTQLIIGSAAGAAPTSRPNDTSPINSPINETPREPRPPVRILTGATRVPLGTRDHALPVLVRLAAPRVPATHRPRLNIGLVLDTSGSMNQEEKIGYLKSAAATLVRYLGPDDMLSVVTYADEPTVVLPGGPFPGARTLLHKLDMLKAEGRTNLAGGIQTGFKELGRGLVPQRLSRLIVLTDGLANVGITAPAGLIALASQIRHSGASVTTIALGHDADTNLMEQMAAEGGGRFHQVLQPEQLPAILAAEVEGLLPQTMGDASIELDLAPDVALTNAYGYPVSGQSQRPVISVGSLWEGAVRTLMIDLKVSCPAAGDRPVGTVQIGYWDRLAQPRWATIKRSISVHCSSDLLAEAPDEDRLVNVYSRFLRSLDRLELAISSGDRTIKRDAEAFLAKELPSVRADALSLGDRELIDMLSLFDHGYEELAAWGAGAHHHGDGDDDDGDDDAHGAATRSYLMQHHGHEHKLLRPEWEGP